MLVCKKGASNEKNTIIILLIILLATILTGNPLVKNENIINIVIGISGIFIIIKNKKEKNNNNK